MELDEAQRDASDAFALRQQLANAQQSEAHLRQQLAQARKQLAGSAAASVASQRGPGKEDGDEASPRSSQSFGGARGGGSSAGSSPARPPGGRQAGGGGGVRLEATARELAAVKQEVGWSSGWAVAVSWARRIGSACLPSAACPMHGPLVPSCLLAPADFRSSPSLLETTPQVARLQEDRDRLRDELEGRDAEVMQLQGQLAMMRSQLADDQNWLSPLPDPY